MAASWPLRLSSPSTTTAAPTRPCLPSVTGETKAIDWRSVSGSLNDGVLVDGAVASVASHGNPLYEPRRDPLVRSDEHTTDPSGVISDMYACGKTPRPSRPRRQA